MVETSTTAAPTTEAESRLLDASGLQALLDALARRGYQVIGPQLRDGTIDYAPLDSIQQLPAGWTEVQQPGGYRVAAREDERLFGYTVGPQSWKPFLFPPEQHVLRAASGGQVEDGLSADDVQPRAFVGVRACDLHAIAIQDRVFLGGQYVDPVYGARRERCFIVAVDCAEPAATCFCVSMGSGPRAEAGYDLALTELAGQGSRRLLVRAGSARGAALLRELPGRTPAAGELEAARQVTERAVARMGRRLETAGLREALYANLEHPAWAEVAERCLACGNCTMVCPTCFCSTFEDVTDLSGETFERRRHWDSCFSLDYSYIHGGSVRRSTRSRYRQWLTHKLASWFDQFGTSGCVGCGRCITWCPVGIDITEIARAIREPVGAAPAAGE